MKTFKQFIKSSGSHYVPDSPVHFKMGNFSPADSGGELTVESKKSTVSSEDWLNKNDNEEHYGQSSHALHISSFLRDHSKEYNDHEAEHIREYTQSSNGLNQHLIDSHNKKPGSAQHRIHYKSDIKHLDSATNQKLARPLHVYSGLGFNPKTHMKDTDKLHLPAYTSVTHSKHVALRFAERGQNKTSSGIRAGENHILHIHLKKDDKAAHVSHFSDVASEHESILPRKTTLKIDKTPEIIHHEDWNGHPVKVHVWHATVHHQE